MQTVQKLNFFLMTFLLKVSTQDQKLRTSGLDAKVDYLK
mgnify:CR=1 FL=1